MMTRAHTRESIRRAGMRLLGLTSLVTLLTVLASGALWGQQTEQTREAGEKTDEVTHLARTSGPVELYVRNNNWLDARIYAVRQGTRYRLGTVTSFQTEKFELPGFVSTEVGGVQILVLPIGGSSSHVTEGINALPGDILALEVEERLPLTAFYRAR